MSKQGRQQNSPQSLPLSPLWSVREEAFQTALSALSERDTSLATFTAYMEHSGRETEECKPYEVVNGVALVPLTGVLTRDRGWWSWLFGGTSIVQQRLALMQAAEDEEVSSILIYAYSPGGEVYGIGDFVGSVLEAKKKKKVWAYIADEGCSAAYWAICRADKILCNATAIVGSIGIMQVVEDWSAAYRKQGVKVKVFKSGEYKGAGVPGTSLTEEQEAETQRLVDAMADNFFEAVQSGRKLSDDQMEAISTGQVWLGQEAIEMGLCDEIGTLEAAIARLAPKEPASPANGMRRYGAQNPQPPVFASGKKEKPMREFFAKLAAAFAQRGRNHLAAAALGAKEDDMDDLVNRLNAQVEAEVQTAVQSNPLLSALHNAEIKTADALHAILQEAKDGRDASQEVNAQLQAEAVRNFGQEAGPRAYAAYEHLSLTARRETIAQWKAEADRKFGTSPTTPAPRQTVPTALARTSVDAEGGQEEVLSASERSNIRAAVGGTAKNGGGK